MRRAIQPFDVTLRHGRRTQFVRRVFLAFSVALTVLVPLWHVWSLGQPGVVGAPTSLRIGTLELVDPLEGIATATVLGWTVPLAWTLLPGVLLIAVLGRFFCGWACPYLPVLALSGAARRICARLGVPVLDVRLPRHSAVVVMVAIVLVGALTGTQLVPLLYPPAVIGREAFRVIFYGSIGSGAALIAVAFTFDAFISRAGFCRSICPGGAMFSLIGARSPLVVVNERTKCTDCTVCDVICNLDQSPMTGELDSGCERCGRCIAACPTRALSWGVRR